jgi:hypothetical protein
MTESSQPEAEEAATAAMVKTFREAQPAMEETAVTAERAGRADRLRSLPVAI